MRLTMPNLPCDTMHSMLCIRRELRFESNENPLNTHTRLSRPTKQCESVHSAKGVLHGRSSCECNMDVVCHFRQIRRMNPRRIIAWSWLGFGLRVHLRDVRCVVPCWERSCAHRRCLRSRLRQCVCAAIGCIQCVCAAIGCICERHRCGVFSVGCEWMESISEASQWLLSSVSFAREQIPFISVA